MCYVRVSNGMPYQRNWEPVPPSMIAFRSGRGNTFSRRTRRAGLTEYDEVQGIEWEWQSVDGAMTKAPLGKDATGPNPTDRGKRGTKGRPRTDEAGIPLALVVDGANPHHVRLLCATLDGIVIMRPEPT